MDKEKVDEVIANYVYAIDYLNIIDANSPYTDLIELQQIYAQSNEIEKKLNEEKLFEIDAPLKKMCELSKQLYNALKKRNFCKIWTELSKLDVSAQYRLSEEEMTWRTKDLFIDIKQLYQVSMHSTSIYISNFSFIAQMDISLNQEDTLKRFVSFVKLLVEEMVDLDERLRNLKEKFEKHSTKLTLKTHPYAKAKLLTKHCFIICYKYNFDLASNSDFEELKRLNRRMYVVLKEADFFIFSERDEKRYNVISRLAEFTAVLKNDENLLKLSSVVKKMDSLKFEIYKYRVSFIEKCLNYDLMFQHFAKMRLNFRFWKNEQQKIARTLLERFNSITMNFKDFYDRFHRLRKFIDPIWNEEEKPQV